MSPKSLIAGLACAVAVAAAGAQATPASPNATPARPSAQPAHAARQEARRPKPRLDRSGRRRVGVASVYGAAFSGRKMADGTHMNPQDDSAASKTLPLGTTAKVTNLRTGESAVVTIRDRGPYAKGRIVDLSPATAAKVGIDRHDGVSKVEVAPIDLPRPGGGADGGLASPQARPGGLRPGAPASPVAR